MISPWTADGIHIDYPAWAAYARDLRQKFPREPKAPHPGAQMCRYALVRNRLPVEVPEGWPSEKDEVLAEVICVHDGSQPAVLDALWFPDCGYSLHFSAIDVTARRELSEEAKQSIRRKALRRRMEAKQPLFAEEAINLELTSRPEYFGEGGQ